MSDRLKAPAEFKRLGMLMSKNHLLSHKLKELKPKRVYELIKEFDVFRNNDLIYKFMDASMADAQGRLGFENNPYPQRAYMHGMVDAVKSVSTKPIVESGLKGKEFGEALDDARLRALIDNYHAQPEKIVKHMENFGGDLENYNNLTPENKFDLFSKLKVSSSSFVLTKVLENMPEVDSDKVMSDVGKFNSIDGKSLVEEGLEGKEVGSELKKRKINALALSSKKCDWR